MLEEAHENGQETITNHSSGTVQVVVSVRGYYSAASVPDPAQSVSAAVSGQSATVTWSPPATDGGAAITGYTISAAPDGAQPPSPAAPPRRP